MGWFAAHRGAFDPAMDVPKDNDGELRMVKEINSAQVKLWNEVGDFPSQNRDEIWSVIKNNWPKERAEFFYFRSLLGACHPGPDMREWTHFGFCACHDESEEQFLDLTYKILANRCSFEAFFTAWNTSKLTELRDANGLRGRRIALPYLEDVLSGAPRQFRSVWSLKELVQNTQSSRSHIVPSITVDYGFMNCKSDSEYQDLRDLYKCIFERRDANPLKLHEACLSESLYEYVLGLIPELKKKKNRAKKFQRLLRNIYPLPNLDDS